MCRGEYCVNRYHGQCRTNHLFRTEKQGLIEELIERLYEIHGFEYEESDPVAVALRRANRIHLDYKIKKGLFIHWVEVMFLFKREQPSIFKCLKQATLDKAQPLRDLFYTKTFQIHPYLAHWHFYLNLSSKLRLDMDSSSEQLVTIPENMALAFNVPPLTWITYGESFEDDSDKDLYNSTLKD